MGAAALLRLVRWPGAVTAAANGSAAFLLAHRPDSPGGTAAVIGAAGGGFLVYAGGVVLNDVADAERDVEEHPGRPLPSGAVERGAALRFGLALLFGGILLCAGLAGLDAGVAALASAVLAAFYDFGARRSRLLAALVLGAARGTNAAAGALAATGSYAVLVGPTYPSGLPLLFPAAIALYTVLLTLISTLESRELPRWVPSAAAVLLAVAAGAAWAFFPRTRWAESPAIPLVLLFGSLVSAARAATDPGGPGLGAVVRAGVFGFVLVDAMWLFGAGRYDAGFWWILVYVGLRAAMLRARS